MKYDDLVEYLGELGPYQKRTYFLVGLPCISAAIQALLPVFILAVPDHRCAIPGYPNDTYKNQTGFQQSLIDYTLPYRKDGGSEDDDEYPWYDAQCKVYEGRNARNFMNSSDVIHTWGDDTTSCHEWVYDREVFDNTFVTEQDFVCDDKVLKSHANMVYMCGLLVGSIFYGYVSDRLGRKTAIMSSVLIHVVSTFTISFADNFVFFAILRFIIGTSAMGIFMCCFVLGMEILGRQYRAQGGIAMQFFWVFGMFVLNLLAYFIRDWRTLQLVVSSYTILYLILYWFIPESPRWQMSQGQLDKAKVTMERVAKVNGKDLPKDAFVDEKEVKEVAEPQGKITDLFASRVLLARAIVVFINWLVVTMVYYGLTLNVGSLGGSIYVNFSFSGIVELLGNIATLFALPIVGRKKFHCFSMLLGGTACLASMIPAVINTEVDPWVNVLLSNVGKFGATGGFSTIYVYTAELFPTFMRNSVVGASSMIARLGGIAAPYIADLGVLVGGQFGTALPYIVFGACSVLAGLLALTLPETLNMGIPETIEDAISFGKAKPDSKNGDDSVDKYRLKTEINGKEEINKGVQGEIMDTHKL